MSEQHVGKVVQVMGAVLDVRFAEGELPALLHAIEVDMPEGKLIAEVAQQIGDDTVRCIAMSSTDGLVRGAGRRGGAAADARRRPGAGGRGARPGAI